LRAPAPVHPFRLETLPAPLDHHCRRRRRVLAPRELPREKFGGLRRHRLSQALPVVDDGAGPFFP